MCVIKMDRCTWWARRLRHSLGSHRQVSTCPGSHTRRPRWESQDSVWDSHLRLPPSRHSLRYTWAVCVCSCRLLYSVSSRVWWRVTAEWRRSSHPLLFISLALSHSLAHTPMFSSYLTITPFPFSLLVFFLTLLHLSAAHPQKRQQTRSL